MKLKKLLVAMLVLVIAGSVFAACGRDKKPVGPDGDKIEIVDNRASAYKTYTVDDEEIKSYASLYQAIDDLMAEGETGDYIKHIEDDVVIYTNNPGSSSDEFYFYNESSYMKHGVWDANFNTEINENPKTHTVNAKDGALNFASYAVKSNKGVDAVAAWMFSKASPANVEIQPLLYSGIQKASFKAELTKSKVAPSFNEEQKTYARVGFLSQQGYVVADLGIVCDTSTGKWYMHTGTRGMDDDNITIDKDKLVMGSKWDADKKEFTPEDDVIITVEQNVKPFEDIYEAKLTVTTVNGNKTQEIIFDHEKLESGGTLAINASLNPDIITNGRFTYDLMNGSYLKNLRISDAKGFVKEGLESSDYDGNNPVLAAGEYSMHTLSEANNYTVVYNDEHAMHSFEDNVDIISLDFSLPATDALSMIPIEKVTAIVEALPAPTDVTMQDETDITAARKAFDKLIDLQKALLDASVEEKLEKCETALQNSVMVYTAYDENDVAIYTGYSLFAVLDELLVNNMIGSYIKDQNDNVVFEFDLSENKSFFIFNEYYNKVSQEGWSGDASGSHYADAWIKGNNVLNYNPNSSNPSDYGKLMKRPFEIIKLAGYAADQINAQVMAPFGPARNRVNFARTTFAQAHTWADGNYEHKSATQVWNLTQSVIKASENPLQSAIAMIYCGYGYAPANGKVDIGIYLDPSKVNAAGKAEWKFMVAQDGEAFKFTDIVVATATLNDNGEFVTDNDLVLETTYIYGALGTAALSMKVTKLNADGMPVAGSEKTYEHKLKAALASKGTEKAFAYGAAFTVDTWTNNRKVADLSNGGYFRNLILSEATIEAKYTQTDGSLFEGTLDMMFSNAAGHQQVALTYGAPNVSIDSLGGIEPTIFNFDYSRQLPSENRTQNDYKEFKALFDALALTKEKIDALTLEAAEYATYASFLTEVVAVTPKELFSMLSEDNQKLFARLLAKIAELNVPEEPATPAE